MLDGWTHRWMDKPVTNVADQRALNYRKMQRLKDPRPRSMQERVFLEELTTL